MDGLGEALGRFNKSKSSENPEENDTDRVGKKEPSETSEKGHSFHVHKHKDGTHHLTVHGANGQLVHHSEHGSLEEAAEEMKQHGD